MFSESKESWVVAVTQALRKSSRWYSSEVCHLLLVNNALRTEGVVLGRSDTAAWMIYPSTSVVYEGAEGWRKVMLIPFGTPQQEYAEVLKWVGEKQTSVMNITQGVAEALLSRKVATRSCAFFDDYVVDASFSGGWAGGKWKEVRRSMRATTAKPVSLGWSDVAAVDAIWVANKTAENFQLAFQHHDGQGKSQIEWLAENQALLSELGIRSEIVGWEKDGQIASVQVFSEIGSGMFYAFTHRSDHRLVETHMCYEEMERGFLAMPGVSKMNDGNAVAGTSLAARKARYSCGKFITRTLWRV